jgi:hypothetical protein
VVESRVSSPRRLRREVESQPVAFSGVRAELMLSRGRSLEALRWSVDDRSPTCLLSPSKIGQHCADVARKLFGVRFPRVANFSEDWIGFH